MKIPAKYRRLSVEKVIIASIFAITSLLSHDSIAAGAMMFVADTQYDYDEVDEIHLMQADGTKHRRIIPRYGVGDASLDPRGNAIAYSRTDKPELRLINVDGRKDRLITKVFSYAGTIQWSPNGRYIAFGYVLTNLNNIIGDNVVSIYDFNRKRITATYNISPSIVANGLVNFLSRIEWSPDSRHILVQEQTEAFSLSFFRVSFDTYHVDNRTKKVKLLGDYRNYGFLNNKQYLAPLASGHIGIVDLKDHLARSNVLLGALYKVLSITAAPGGKELLEPISKCRKSEMRV